MPCPARSEGSLLTNGFAGQNETLAPENTFFAPFAVKIKRDSLATA
jgi:hypothetical protein